MMNHPEIAQTIAAFALHALWQVPLLAGATALAVRMGRPQARVAYALWVTTLLLCVLMPVGATVTARRVALQAQRDAAATVAYTGAEYVGALPGMERLPAWQRMLNRHLSVRNGVHPFAVMLPAGAARGIAAVYLAVVFCLGLRLLLAWWRSHRLVAAAPGLWPDADIADALARQCGALGMATPPVRTCDEVPGPALAGVFHPTLLLPACAEAMTPAEMEAVLAHEVAHLRRYDPPVHCACSLLLVAVGFHPAALWVAYRVRQTREMACDAEAAVRMGSAVRYAHALLQVAERTGAGIVDVAGRGFFGDRLGLFNTGLGLFSKSLELNGGALEERMRMMMHGSGSGSAGTCTARWFAGAVVGGIALSAAAMLQVQPALAQQQQQPFVIAVPAMEHPPAVFVMNGAEEPQLLGGSHAQDQLQKARRALDAAANKATTDEERKKIATARAVLGAAQEQLTAAGSDGGKLDLKIDMDEWKKLNIDPLVRVMIRDLKIDPQVKVLIEKQTVDAKKIRAEVEKHRAEFDRMRAEVQSPAFQARIRAQVEAAKKQMAAANIDQAQMQRLLKDATQQREQAMKMLRSGELQRQIDAANSMIARLEVPAAAGDDTSHTLVVPDAPATSAAQDKRIKVEARVMTGNILTKTQPVYPQEAKDAKISGAVVLHALIDETGKVESLQIISSPDKSLSQSAVAAVQQWTYKPYLLNGNPMAVETTVTVNYSFGG